LCPATTSINTFCVDSKYPGHNVGRISPFKCVISAVGDAHLFRPAELLFYTASDCENTRPRMQPWLAGGRAARRCDSDMVKAVQEIGYLIRRTA
jgi:hypothetical protein